jgi:hypothetical protein
MLRNERKPAYRLLTTFFSRNRENFLPFRVKAHKHTSPPQQHVKNKLLLTVIVLPALNVVVMTAIALQSSIGTYALIALLCITAVSCATALTRAGAQAEVTARGIASTPFGVIMVANGTATLSHKLAVVSSTVMGAFMSPLWIIVSLIIGGFINHIAS